MLFDIEPIRAQAAYKRARRQVEHDHTRQYRHAGEAPPRVADPLIENRPPNPEQRARG
ncbi:hypothetical protein [Actinoplanes cyaneus]|uniref:hypothetical protein n=1 Tax=Actinoplanes cyaneus TaxID=52696 RepID=UPI001944055B|nr:hypothetical protein [Actinoplanes cyaneus]